MASFAFDRKGLQTQGFGGFVTFEELWDSWRQLISAEAGVYVVLRESDDTPRFLDSNPGGRFKDQDPTVPVPTLAAKWVEGAQVIYIGKGDNLRKRLKEYARFGRGDKVGHWGGRYIWQLADSSDLVVAWRRCDPEVSARVFETELLEAFLAQHRALPFANINR